MNRRTHTRETLMQLLYQMMLANDYSEAEEKQFLSEYSEDENLSSLDQPLFDAVLTAVRDNIETIDASINEASDHWKIERISRVDLAILRLSTAEILFLSDDIPVNVSINEAVEIAKKYGSERSPKFVNGILGRIVRKNEI